MRTPLPLPSCAAESEPVKATMNRALDPQKKGAVLWLTGLSGAGKSSISRGLARELAALGVRAQVLDGDNVRRRLCRDLGFSPEDRAENIRRVAEVARLMAEAGLVVIAAFISPYRADRQRAREIATEGGLLFVEIHIAAPLAVCETRDVKGLYEKARAGEIADFTGISAPYEAPENAEITLPTDRQTVAESVAEVLAWLRPRLG